MGDDTNIEQVVGAAGAAAVADGLARFAASVVDLPAVGASSLADADEGGRAAELLGRAWDLAAFTPSGALVLEVLDAAGARVELVGGVPAAWGRRRDQGRVHPGGASECRLCELDRGEGEGEFPPVSSHARAVAAWGAPPGRRVTAMGMVPGPDGDLLRASCGLVLRLPAAAIDDVVRVGWILAWHAAMHAAERRAMPARGRLAAALDQVDLEFAIPRVIRERRAWADRVALRVVGEIGLAG